MPDPINPYQKTQSGTPQSSVHGQSVQKTNPILRWLYDLYTAKQGDISEIRAEGKASELTNLGEIKKNIAQHNKDISELGALKNATKQYFEQMPPVVQKYIQDAQRLEEEAGGKNDPDKLKQAKALKEKIIDIQLKIDRARDQYQQTEEKIQEFKTSKVNLEKRLEELGNNKKQPNNSNAGGAPVGFNSLINLLSDALGLGKGKLNKGGFGGGRLANGGLVPGLPGGGGIGNNAPALGNGLGYLAAAKAILKAIALVTMQHISAHPIPNIARAETNEKLARLAISYLDAAQVDSALQGTVANQDIIFTKTQASTIEGDAKTAKAYWTQALQNDKQDNKDTHKLADRA